MSKMDRQILVEIIAFALMPNHYHLMLRQVQDDGIARFMQKLGTGYTMYFNKKYSRTGVLFQGKFKAVHVDRDHQVIQLAQYIHANPLKLNVRNEPAVDYLLKYRWSSFPDYTGKKNFPSVICKGLLMRMTGGESGYLKYESERYSEAGPRNLSS
jgi:putative transposase